MTTQLTELLAEMEARGQEFKMNACYAKRLKKQQYWIGKKSEAQFIIEKLKQLLKDSPPIPPPIH